MTKTTLAIEELQIERELSKELLAALKELSLNASLMNGSSLVNLKPSLDRAKAIIKFVEEHREADDIDKFLDEAIQL